jgi:hypothetical protein
MSNVRVTWRGREISAAERKAAARAIKSAAEFLLEQSNRTVPHDEGVLQNSGAVDMDEQAVEASVYYDTPYAVVQHEDLTIRHDAGRRAKWLEATCNEEADAVRRWIEQELSAALGG